MCRGTGPGKAFTLASLRQVLAGGGAGPWCLPADCGGEEPSEKEKGEDLDFVAQGLPKRGAHTLGSTKDDLLGCQKKLLDFLLYIFLISCSKSMFVSCNEWSFFFLSKEKSMTGTSLVAWRVRIHLPVQGTQV